MVKEKICIPVYVMIRPRGGDFLYDDNEFMTMRYEIEVFKQYHADGFVFGILSSDGTVDKTRNKELIDLCKPSPITFHRAFDVVRDGSTALEDLINLGFDRVLTSGLEATALEGLPNLIQLVKQAGERIIIVPGGGITEKNVERIMSQCQAKEFHGSARVSNKSKMDFQRGDIHMGAALYPPEYSIKVSSQERIQEFINIVRKI